MDGEFINAAIAALAELKTAKTKEVDALSKAIDSKLTRVGELGVKGAEQINELLRYQTSKSGDETISFKEYVDRMKEGQYDIFYITGESVAAVLMSTLSSSSRSLQTLASA